MTCDDFRQWLGTGGAKPAQRIPDAFREHSGSCAACRELLDEERLWRRLFAAVPEPSCQRPAWPGVVAGIREEERRRTSLSDALLLFSRRLAPTFALVVLLLGGVGWWRGLPLQPREQVPVTIAMLEGASGQEAGLAADEPDAVLIAWAGAGQP